MKFSWLDENDKDVRWFLKTYPFIAPIFVLFFGFILYVTVYDQAVSMRDGYSTIDFDIVELSMEKNPIFFFSVVIFEFLIVSFLCFYIFARLKIRARICREDSAKS